MTLKLFSVYVFVVSSCFNLVIAITLRPSPETFKEKNANFFI